LSDINEIDSIAVKRAMRQLKKYDQKRRSTTKRSEDYQVLEEVFDLPTLMTLHNLMNSRILHYLNGVMSSGKESRVYWGVREDTSNVAVKIYLTISAEFRKRLPYIVGDPRFTRVKKDIKSLVNLWARKEYKNLKIVYSTGIPCPEPYTVARNVLVMQFIGENGKPAQTLDKVDVNKQDYRKTLIMMQKLYRDAGLVHADLSEYNIFKFKRQLILFDFGSAVYCSHPNAEEFLVRDITNINRFFVRRNVDILSLEDSLKLVKGK
jgi:RIO kinase 1|tara:strand:+ start:690 stop:1481 length:792 start_codon:yes stop_codon:yes gene_type:complete